MLTMEDVTGGPGALLLYLADRGAESFRCGGRTVDAVAVCGTGWRLPEGRRRLRDGVAILPREAAPHETGPALRELVSRGTVAAVLTGEPGPLDEHALMREAARVGLPLLAPVGELSAGELETELVRRQLEAAQALAALSPRLIGLATRLFQQGEGPQRLLEEASQVTGGPVRLLAPGAADWDDLAAAHGPMLARIRQGQVQTAAVMDEGEHLLLHAAGQAPPHPVVAAWLSKPWPRHLRQLITLLAGQVAMLSYPVEHQREREEIERARAGIRVSILQYLMLGEWETATRVAASLRAASEPTAGMFAVEHGVMAVLEVAQGEDRTEVASACQSVLPRALVVLCPADWRHVLIIAADREDGPDVLEALRPVVGQVPGRTAGVSTAQPWSRIADAYDAAIQALAAAARETGRIMRDPGGTRLAVLLSPQARVWARRVRAGVDRLGQDTAAQAVPTARRALAFGTVRAASLVGVDRSTARKRLAAVMEAMGLDHRQVAHRAVADLVFHLCDLPAPDFVADIRPRLRALLQEAAVVEWAKRELAVLDDPAAAPAGGWLGRGTEEEPGCAARQLAVTWLDTNCHNMDAATILGLHRNTLPTRLAALGARVRLPLLSPGSGPYSMLWQLAGAGHIPGSTVPDPADTEQAAHPPQQRRPGAYGAYDFYRGGQEHDLSDRELGERVAAVLPNIGLHSKSNRAYVLNSARYLAETLAVRQFLDIGAGQPSAIEPNLHDVVAGSGARVVYVDHDEDVVQRGKQVLDGHAGVAIVNGDLLQPDEIMEHPTVTGLLDLDQPVAVCLHTVLHYILDESKPRDLIEAIMDPLPSGSFISITHGTTDVLPATEEAVEVYRQAGFAVQFRSRHAISDLMCCGMQILEPGIVPVQDWAPPGGIPTPSGLPDGQVVSYALIARKP